MESDTSESADIRIERHFAKKILSGALAPGTRLPNSIELAKKWAASTTTVQKAMMRLSAAGLVDRGRKSGTVVRSRLKRAVIGIIVGPSLADETAHIYRALVASLEALLHKRALTCRVYDGVHPMCPRTSSEYRPLDILKIDQVFYAFKGLIQLGIGRTPPPEIASSGLPSSVLGWEEGKTDILFDHQHFARETLSRLTKRGHKKILIVSFKGEVAPFTEEEIAFSALTPPAGVEITRLPLVLQERGYHIDQVAFQAISEAIVQWEAAPASRPDAIVVTDDILARGACMALLKSNLRVPEDLEIVVKAAESIHHFYGLPVHRYEISSLETAGYLDLLLWKRIIGENLPQLPVRIRGRFREMED